ncbi:MAG: hypothetical protein ACM3NQ_00610 [Bacteroidales bacterium]
MGGAAAAVTVFYSPDYTATRFAFDTVRKAAWVAASLTERPIEGVRVTTPQLLTSEGLERVHAAEYVRAVGSGEPRWLAESSGIGWDPAVWTAVRASNGGAVAAALHALRERTNAGSLSSGLHHASHASGAGFCTFNGLGLAARAALDAGASCVLIVDLDAHCGGGTWSLVRDWPGVRQLDIAVSRFDGYQPEPASGSTLDIVARSRAYLPTLASRLHALDAEHFDLVIYNAGMDVHQASGIGGLIGIDEQVISAREQAVFAWARGRAVPVAFVLAGGYTGGEMSAERLVNLHRMTMTEAACRG